MLQKFFLMKTEEHLEKMISLSASIKKKKTTTDVLVRSILFLSDTPIRIKHVAKLGTLT